MSLGIFTAAFGKRFTAMLGNAALPLVLLAACTAPLQTPAPPENATATISSPAQEALRKLMLQQGRLDRVAAPLLINNHELCKNHARKLLGFSAKNKYSYSTELAETAASAFGFDERLQVTNVLIGSGAARVGVQRGDIVVSAEGKPIAHGHNAERHAAALLAPMVQNRASLKLTLERNGAPLTLDIPLTLSCGFGIELGNADHVNAYADGRRIIITRGLLDFAQSDAELAYVIAREMAHNVLGHANRQRLAATMGGIIDNLIRVHPDLSSMTGMSGVTPFPQELDAEADRLALYLAVRAGYAIDEAPRFWQRLAVQYPASVPNAYTATHPATTQRLAAIEKTLAEIRSRQATNRPLLP